jgi:hypothetical protein
VGKRAKKTEHPYRYIKFRGCFGASLRGSTSLQAQAILGDQVGIYDEFVFESMTQALDDVMRKPELILDMRAVKSITIRGALLLKAFFDEYLLIHGERPKIRGPKERKMRAVLNYLEIGRYQDVKKLHYADIDCWQILSWDHSQENIQFAKLLHDEIIPQCWKGSHAITEYSAGIAMSVAEALLNCKEHAYTGDKEVSVFKKWYLGVGEYPNTGKFSFCIYDKGVGISSRLKAKPEGWLDNITDVARSDSDMIKLATRGRSGAGGNTDGRGQGLKTAVEVLASNNGGLDIYSGHGFFSTHDENGGKDRRPKLDGTMVAFSFPVEYTKDSA